MLFSTPLFLFLFQPLSILLYWIAPRAWRNAVLLAISMAFYGWGESRFIGLVLASALFDYAAGERIARRGRYAKAWLGLGITLNLMILASFKYLDFILRNVEPVFGALPHLNLVLPIGISFIVFEKITYLVDIHRGTSRPAASLSGYLLFVFLFPKILAGPIIKYYEIDTFLRDRPLSLDLAASGLSRFLWGLTKKVLIADVCGETADAVFALPAGAAGFSTAWLGVTAFTVQIYFDFSGYSDMAIGLARIFGFRLRENFDHPYGAASFTEFWRRWHISLSTWIRDYLYFPLGGSRGGAIRTCANLWICFLLSGLWHGAAWNFVLWGAWNGLFLMCDRLFWLRVSAGWPRLPRVGVTLLLIMAGWAIFRAPNLATLGEILWAMMSPGLAGTFIDVQADQRAAIAIGFTGALIAATGMARALAAAVEACAIGRAAVAAGVVLLGTVAVAKTVTVTFNPFLYFRF